MNWPIAVVFIVAIIGLAEVFKAKYRAKHGIITDAMGGEKPIAPPIKPALEREVEELRERIKVLERIATEDTETKRLSTEIERLRDK
jgi:hypothetical protein